MCNDFLHLRRLALAPIIASQDLQVWHASINAFNAAEQSFLGLLQENGLGPIWHWLLNSHTLSDALSPASLSALKTARLAAAAHYVKQCSGLHWLDQAFRARNISYAVIKGVHIREAVYAEPALRWACDVDVLITLEQREQAAKLLIDAGFRYFPHSGSASHEAAFVKGDMSVDLHWNVLRPGRTRFDVTALFLARRRRSHGFWGLGDTDAVFLMLVHPAFTKYVCSPYMSLCRVVDFYYWTRQRGVDWAALAQLLNDTGLQTAAWTVLQWFAGLGVPVPANFVQKIGPGRMRARYLRAWLQHNLPTRWLQRPLLIQLGLTLFLHDRPTDAWRAIRGWCKAVINSRQDPLLHLVSRES